MPSNSRPPYIRRWPIDGVADELGIIPIEPVGVDRRAQVSWIELEIPSSYPIIDEVKPSAVNTLAQAHSFSSPNGIVAGDLWVAVCIFSDATTTSMTVTDPEGWVRRHFSQYLSLGFLVLLRDATGSEGSTFNVSTDTTTRGVCLLYRYRNGTWFDDGNLLNAVEMSTPTNGFTGSSPNFQYDPAALNPSTWDVENTEWLAVVATVFNGLSSKTGNPANYTDLQSSFSTDDSPRMQIHGMKRDLAVASEDPAPYVFSNNNPGISVTLAVRPSGGGTPSPRRGQVSWVELELPPAPGRRAQVSWVELEIPDFNRRAQVSWVELEIPSNDRSAQISWVELEIPDFNKRAQISWVELEIPSVVAPAQTATQLRLFTLLVEAELAMMISVKQAGTTPWLQNGNAWFYSLGTRNTIDNVRKRITGVALGNEKGFIEVGSIQACKNTTGSWTYIAGNNEVWIRPHTTINPNNFLALAKFKMYWSNYAVHYNGEFYESRVLLAPGDLNRKMTAGNELMQNQTLNEGRIRLARDVFLDSLLRDYIWIGQSLVLKTLINNVDEVQTTNNIIGVIERSDPYITLDLWT